MTTNAEDFVYVVQTEDSIDCFYVFNDWEAAKRFVAARGYDEPIYEEPILNEAYVHLYEKDVAEERSRHA